MTTKTFDLADVISVYSGILLPNPQHEHPVDTLYTVMNHVTGQSLMTHQLATLHRPVADDLKRQHPFLESLTLPERGSQSDAAYLEALTAWVVEQKKIHGDTVEVTTKDDFEKVGPFDGLPKGKPVIAVQVDR